MTTDAFPEIERILTRAKRIILLNPKRPDGDSISSALAFFHALTACGIEATVFGLGAPSTQYDYLPGIDRYVTEPDAVSIADADVVLAFDFADPKMSGLEHELAARKAAGKPIIVFDHHPTNMAYGTINVVDHTLASATELVYRFFEDRRWPITKDIATCLLTGIITDTSHFKNLNTTYSVIHVASKLLSLGARHREITEHVTRHKSFSSLKLWGLALSRLTKHPSLNVAWTVITRKDMERYHVDEEAAEGIANFLNSLSGADAILVLRETDDGELKGSLRTTTPGVDVSRLAKLFGGGGHDKAAGFTIKGRVEQTPNGWRILPN